MPKVLGVHPYNVEMPTFQQELHNTDKILAIQSCFLFHLEYTMAMHTLMPNIT